LNKTYKEKNKMPITLEDALIFTLKWEGTKFTDHPLDPGGATKYGIIQSRYDQYRVANKLPKQSVNKISKKEYTDIYEDYYWEPVRAKWLDGTLGLALFDTAVNLGVGGCISRLQAALRVPITGKWTQEISDVIHQADQLKVALKICQLRIKKRYDRVKQRPDQKVFLKGWLNRDNDLIRKVNSMAGVTILSEIEELNIEPDIDDISEEDLEFIYDLDEDR
jgi:lysozyme family protein